MGGWHLLMTLPGLFKSPEQLPLIGRALTALEQIHSKTAPANDSEFGPSLAHGSTQHPCRSKVSLCNSHQLM